MLEIWGDAGDSFTVEVTVELWQCSCQGWAKIHWAKLDSFVKF